MTRCDIPVELMSVTHRLVAHCMSGMEPRHTSTEFLEYPRLDLLDMLKVPLVVLAGHDPLAACFFT